MEWFGYVREDLRRMNIVKRMGVKKNGKRLSYPKFRVVKLSMNILFVL